MAADPTPSRAPGPHGPACPHPPGVLRPVIDVRRCEGKAACVAVCPYGVFAIGRVDDATYARQPWYIRLKLWVHRRKTALTPRADACHGCGLCVAACPEQAIRLVPGEPAHPVAADGTP